ncbi:MAG: OmpA family protein [Candidatus Omnitrophota bacterium]
MMRTFLFFAVFLAAGFGLAGMETRGQNAAAARLGADLAETTHPDIFRAKLKKKVKKTAEAITQKKEEKAKNLPMRTPMLSLWKALPIKSVYFDYNMWNLKPVAQQGISVNIDFLKSNPECYILIEGHCDERGTPEYNIALGDQRANAVKTFMVEGGVAEERITTKSWGEELPVDLGHSEDAWGRNRRAEMYFSKL